MATKKKTKKPARRKPATAPKKSSKRIAKKGVAKKSLAKKPGVRKIFAKKASAPKRSPVTRPSARFIAKPAAKAPAKTAPKPGALGASAKKPLRTRGKQENTETVIFEPVGLGARSGGQSGDLQGLTNRAGADSESVDELLEEGNAFEAEVVKGVEDVPDADQGEIRTHEVAEDDVPREYEDQ
jgi:hypothetical protein